MNTDQRKETPCNFTADWEKGVFNFLPLWVGVALGYFWTSVVIARVKQGTKSVA
jgi:hypothetical protein